MKKIKNDFFYFSKLKFKDKYEIANSYKKDKNFRDFINRNYSGFTISFNHITTYPIISPIFDSVPLIATVLGNGPNIPVNYEMLGGDSSFYGTMGVTPLTLNQFPFFTSIRLSNLDPPNSLFNWVLINVNVGDSLGNIMQVQAPKPLLPAAPPMTVTAIYHDLADNLNGSVLMNTCLYYFK